MCTALPSRAHPRVPRGSSARTANNCADRSRHRGNRGSRSGFPPERPPSCVRAADPFGISPSDSPRNKQCGLSGLASTLPAALVNARLAEENGRDDQAIGRGSRTDLGPFL